MIYYGMEYNAYRDLPGLNKMGECPGCGELHEISYGLKEKNGDLIPNHSVLYIKCEKDGRIYIIE